MFDDLLRDDGNRKSHVIVCFHWCVDIEILHIGAHELTVGCGDEAVEKNLGSGQVGGWCDEVAGMVNQISAESEAHTIWFFLLWANFCDDPSACGNLVLGDLVVRSEVESVGSFLHAITNTLGESP